MGIKPVPAYDFHNGNLCISVNGETVAEFPRRYFANMVLALVKQMKEDIK